mgnify:CR=1 FL=1
MSDVKSIVEQIVKKLQGNQDLLTKFKSDPVKTIEGLSGIDIPDNIEDEVVKGVKAALASDKLSSIAGAVKKLF